MFNISGLTNINLKANAEMAYICTNPVGATAILGTTAIICFAAVMIARTNSTSEN